MLDIDVQGFTWHLTLTDNDAVIVVAILVILCVIVEVYLLDYEGEWDCWLDMHLSVCLLHVKYL